MAIKRLTTPLTEEAVRSLSVNDEVTVSGTIFTCRSQFMMRVLNQGVLPPIDFSEVNAMFHMGGIMKRAGQEWSPVSLLATSSYRFNKGILKITVACLPFIAMLIASVLVITY